MGGGGNNFTANGNQNLSKGEEICLKMNLAPEGRTLRT